MIRVYFLSDREHPFAEPYPPGATIEALGRSALGYGFVVTFPISAPARPQ
jgi:hypothetical protein